MDLGLGGRTAVVTGGSSGIGLAVARLFLREGASVAICGRNAERLEAAVNSLTHEADDERILARVCDVTKADAVASFAAEVQAWSG